MTDVNKRENQYQIGQKTGESQIISVHLAAMQGVSLGNIKHKIENVAPPNLSQCKF